MKKILAILMIGLFLPTYAYAQDIEKTVLGEFQDEEDEWIDIEPIMIRKEDKVSYIIDKIHQLGKGYKNTIKPDNIIIKVDETDQNKVYALYPKNKSDADYLKKVKPHIIEMVIDLEGASAIRAYHSSARDMMKNDQYWTITNDTFLDINEIRMLSQHIEWRSMVPHLSSLDRKASKNFKVWTKMRVESWLVQAEMRSLMQPEEMAKTQDIESIIAKVRLAQKTNEDLEYDYTIDDRVYSIQQARTPEAIAEAEEAKKPFYKRLANKLKFW